MSTAKTTTWEKYPYLKWILGAAGAAVVLYIAYVIYNYVQRTRIQGVLEHSTVQTVITNATTGEQTPVSVDLGTRASAIHSAFFDNDVFGISENEEQAITELLNVPKSVIPNLSATYYQAYGRNLKGDFQSYVSTNEWNKISNLFS